MEIQHNFPCSLKHFMFDYYTQMQLFAQHGQKLAIVPPICVYVHHTLSTCDIYEMKITEKFVGSK